MQKARIQHIWVWFSHCYDLRSGNRPCNIYCFPHVKNLFLKFLSALQFNIVYIRFLC